MLQDRRTDKNDSGEDAQRDHSVPQPHQEERIGQSDMDVQEKAIVGGETPGPSHDPLNFSEINILCAHGDWYKTQHTSTMADSVNRKPNIVITGTPGTGKTTTAQAVVEASSLPLQHINVVELVKQKELHDGFDQEWQSYIVDEDKVRGPVLSSLNRLSTLHFTPRLLMNWSR